MRLLLAFLGGLVGACVQVLLAFLSADLAEASLLDQLVSDRFWYLIGAIVAGIFVGAWLGGAVPVSSDEGSGQPTADRTTTMTRLRAIFSYIKTRGKGIHMSDIFTLGSKVDIETDNSRARRQRRR
jgi:hypothetical protein